MPTLTLPCRRLSRFHVTNLLISTQLLGFPLSFAKGSVGHVAPAPGDTKSPLPPLAKGGKHTRGCAPAPPQATRARRGEGQMLPFRLDLLT